MYNLRLYQDKFSKGASKVTLEAQHSAIYVLRGEVKVNGELCPEDEAVYTTDIAIIEPMSDDLVLWRWDVVRAEEEKNLAVGEGIESTLALSREVRMFEMAPRTKWLFRLDAIINHMGSTGLHSHPGSGIRCLKAGNLKIEGYIAEESDNRKEGDAWYEEGSYPIISTADEGVKATFLRGMILPIEYAEFPDTAIWIEGTKPCKSDWKSYSQEIITLI